MVTDIERAYHVFTFHPDALSWRFFSSHVRAFDVDRRIERLKESGEWPPTIDACKRWPDIGQLIERGTGRQSPLILTLNTSDSPGALLTYRG